MAQASKTTDGANGFGVPSAMPLLTEFTAFVAKARTPAGVLDALDGFANQYLPLNAHGAARFPLQASDWLHPPRPGRVPALVGAGGLVGGVQRHGPA